MALYSSLTLKSDHDSVDLEKHVIESFSSRFACPIAWRALFNSEQIHPEKFIVVSPTNDAIQTLKKRSPVLSLAFGEKWVDGIDQFVDRLGPSKFLELDLQEWYGEPSEFEDHMQKEFEIFSEPFYTTKKSLLTRKPKINKRWRDHIAVYKNDPMFGDIA